MKLFYYAAAAAAMASAVFCSCDKHYLFILPCLPFCNTFARFCFRIEIRILRILINCNKAILFCVLWGNFVMGGMD